ncbi:phosphoribosylformylglycinamidine synthase I [Candidatus Woesearchaeota archaeon]|nr:MAG: phosphoribosylformylglycinamidine synthase I [Candidatus Woesearchaeota archaeon]
MSKPKIAILQFPGVNCEYESKLACEQAGMEAEIYRWNSGEPLDTYDGFLLPGGWSYEDRVRAGAIAAKDPLLEQLREQAALGKPVIGICNGAQILVESGLIPNIDNTLRVDFALAPNINPRVSGYYCTWIHVMNSSKKQTAFNRTMKYEEVLPLPIAHGEGRFVTRNKELIDTLIKNDQIAFRYCNEEGNVINEFPVNPNGSLYSIAALTNPEGNVMAIMPHPERAMEKRQVPGFQGSYEESRQHGPGSKIFFSMKEYIEERRKK